jgi:hypothetical protein
LGTERIKHILEEIYEAADLIKLISTCEHLIFLQHQKLKQIVDKFEDLLDGT